MSDHDQKQALSKKLYHQIERLTEEKKPQLLVAVSGGKDSMALLHALVHGTDQYGYTLRAVHIHHGLRKQSDYEARLLQIACKKWKVPLKVVYLDVKRDRQKGESIEMAARRLRYQALYEQRKGKEWIVTAHHRSDVAETVLMHIIQGTGLKGLCGIPARNDKVIRPMLKIDQMEIVEYLNEHKIAHCEDQSNADLRYLRNRIRHELLPLLREKYNPRIIQSLSRLADRAQEEEAYYKPLVQQLEQKAKKGEVANIGRWYDLLTLCEQPFPVLSRWASTVLVELGLRPEQCMIRKILDLIARAGSDDLAQGWRIKSSNVLEFYQSTKKYQAISIEIGKQHLGSWSIEVNPTIKPNAFPKKNDLIQYFDADAISWPCMMRMKQPGDQMSMPYGKKSISNLQTDDKIPMTIRSHFPVIESQGQILWAVGVARSELAKITMQTQRMIEMRFTYTLEEE